MTVELEDGWNFAPAFQKSNYPEALARKPDSQQPRSGFNHENILFPLRLRSCVRRPKPRCYQRTAARLSFAGCNQSNLHNC
ncbi:hypothetical protein C0Q70_10705 [Pomacea canaliculata]|uniref:Uncharacterized protein n=1 Tax=Pomacea canaliculata TaxID=400727 RepID=A0A2T7P3Z6_POMCA|nr:hypothetical protein C0Q70_10705 [Pomacea canaliculata]